MQAVSLGAPFNTKHLSSARFLGLVGNTGNIINYDSFAVSQFTFRGHRDAKAGIFGKRDALMTFLENGLRGASGDPRNLEDQIKQIDWANQVVVGLVKVKTNQMPPIPVFSFDPETKTLHGAPTNMENKPKGLLIGSNKLEVALWVFPKLVLAGIQPEEVKLDMVSLA